MCTVRASKWLAGPRNHNERDVVRVCACVHIFVGSTSYTCMGMCMRVSILKYKILVNILFCEVNELRDKKVKGKLQV